MSRDDIEEQKALKVQRALQGMWVMYMRHNTSGEGLTPNMAKINGYSIILHVVERKYEQEFWQGLV